MNYIIILNSSFCLLAHSLLFLSPPPGLSITHIFLNIKLDKMDELCIALGSAFSGEKMYGKIHFFENPDKILTPHPPHPPHPPHKAFRSYG